MSAKDERRQLLSECCDTCNSSECSGCPREKAEKEDGGKISISLKIGTYAEMRVEKKLKR